MHCLLEMNLNLPRAQSSCLLFDYCLMLGSCGDESCFLRFLTKSCLGNLIFRLYSNFSSVIFFSFLSLAQKRALPVKTAIEMLEDTSKQDCFTICKSSFCPESIVIWYFNPVQIKNKDENLVFFKKKKKKSLQRFQWQFIDGVKYYVSITCFSLNNYVIPLLCWKNLTFIFRTVSYFVDIDWLWVIFAGSLSFWKIQEIKTGGCNWQPFWWHGIIITWY